MLKVLISHRRIVTSCCMLVTLLISGCITSTDAPPPLEPKPQKAAKTYFELGTAYMKRGRYDLAEQKLQRSIETSPTPEAYNALAVLYETQHDNALAEETYRHLIAGFPDYGRGYLNYNIFLCKYKRQGQIEQLAAEMSRRGKEIAALGQIAAGNCALSQGDKKLAETHYKRALQYESYAAGALLPLAEINLNRGFAAEAKSKVDVVLNHIGYSARAVYLAALINRELGNHREERKMLSVLRSRYAGSAEARAMFKR